MEKCRSFKFTRSKPKHLRGWNCGIALVTMFCCGCSGNTLNWTEEVLLPDGRTVSLKRHQEYEKYDMFEKPGNADYGLEFRNPDTGEIVRWNHDRGLGTVALLIYQRSPYLLTRVADGHGGDAYNHPNPPYLLFEYERGTWNRKALREIPVKQLRSNMTFTGSDAQSRVGANGKHLSTDITRESFADHGEPWVMNFGLLKEQTFGQKNRDLPRNLLIVSPERQ